VIGSFRHRIVIQRPVEQQNEFGEAITSWKDIAEVWAIVEPLQGREYFASQQLQSEVTTRFTIRYVSNLNTKMRLKWQDQVYDIQEIINSKGINRVLQLLAKEIS